MSTQGRVRIRIRRTFWSPDPCRVLRKAGVGANEIRQNTFSAATPFFRHVCNA